MEEECCICMENVPKIILPCAHRFCERCVDAWYVTLFSLSFDLFEQAYKLQYRGRLACDSVHCSSRYIIHGKCAETNPAVCS